VASIVDAARAGDERAFRELTAPYLQELHVHCYRMLGSIDNADDLVQETLIAAWRGLGGFEGRSSLRAWLYRIATNRCLNAIRDGRRRPPTAPLTPPFDPPPPSRAVDVPWLQPYPDDRLEAGADPSSRYQARETIELAFIAALQTLPPRQTAVLLLCDVIGFAVAEVAGMLHASPTAIKGVLQRARASIAHLAPGTVDSARMKAPQAQLAARFAEAFGADDVAGVVALLTDDAWLAMPPALHEYRGPAAIAAFLEASASWRAARRLRLVPTRANSQPAFGCYFEDLATGVVVLTMTSDRIAGVTRFLDPHLHRHFGLPDALSPQIAAKVHA
jgi:RNA polymerase sigma-70 factor (TIGR02960 family)